MKLKHAASHDVGEAGSSARKMHSSCRVAARLVTGLLAVSPGGLAGQEPATTATAREPVSAASTSPAPAPVEVRGADGKPLPPDVQQRLQAQTQQSTAPGEVIVTGDRLRGSATGDVPPERTFNQLDIRAFGANDVQDLLRAVESQVRSDRGRDDGDPVVLLNGRRVSSFAEIARIPAEAIERMEVFPEEQALRYGFRADQKVVNIVVFRRYAARVGQVTYATPTDGGRDSIGASWNFFRIRGDTRYNVSADYNRASTLLESERNVRQAPGVSGLGRFRSLLPEAERFTLDATASGSLLQDVSSTLNARVADSRNEERLGLVGDAPLSRRTSTRDTHLGTTLGGAAAGWTWTFAGNYDRMRNEVATRSGRNGLADARSVDALLDADLLFSGTPLTLPAGPLGATIRGGLNFRDFRSRSVMQADVRTTDLSRNGVTVRGNLNLPIGKPGMDAVGWLGNLSLNLDLGVSRLSDAGTLRTAAFGANWSPNRLVNAIASITREEEAPTAEQLGAPVIVTPNLRTFDFARGETVDVTQVVGGNRALRSDDRRVVSLGLTVKPWSGRDLVLSVDYLNTRVDRPIAVFPIATPAIEAAFPERFARDGDGRLQRVDATPLNFRRADQAQLRWGINLTRPLGALPPEAQNAVVRFAASDADVQRRVPTGGRVTKVAAGSAAARQVENFTSRFYLSVYHTWRKRDEILVREGAAPLDLLRGAAIDQRGGRSRHVVEIQAGAFKRGLGVRATATWQSATRVRGTIGVADGDDLRFSSISAMNVSFFANLADRLGGVSAPSWARGTRISLGVVNVFDERPTVRDASGVTPLLYQPAYLNPLGRTVNLNLRKSF